MMNSGSAWRVGALFGTPIYIQPGYLLMLVLFSYMSRDLVPGDPLKSALIISIAVTVSLLIHEFGHVLAAKWNGHRSQVILVMMGGLTIPSGESRGWRSVLLSVAGPLAGLVTFALLYFVFAPGEDDQTLWPHLWSTLVFINLVWSLFNLLPIYPMDGGQALFSFLKLFRRSYEAQRISAIISMVTAGILAYFALQWGFLIALVILVMMAFDNWQRLQQTP